MTAPSSDKAAIRQTIRALRKADHIITGGHDGEYDFTCTPGESEDSIIGNLMACDSSILRVTLPDGESGWMYFVLGNEPFEVICNHTVNLSPVLDPLTDGWDD